MDNDKLDLVLKKLDDLIFWLKISNLAGTREYFSKVLDTKRKREIYQLSDGRSIAEINQAINITSKSLVLDLWADWTSKGIMTESSKVKGRKIKAIDLKELGLE